MSAEPVTYKQTTDLVFDRHNPRLTDFDLSRTTTDQEIIQILWDTMDVNELVLSIAASGFYPHEPLIIARENDANVVIEGNRRLAAVRVLLDPTIISAPNTAMPQLSEDKRKALQQLPVLKSTREASWRHLGFKHVNGPAMWGSYAKSRYIADVHRKYGVPLDEIAQQIGDTHRTVQRLYRGLMVVEQAERMKIFNREDRYRNHFSFSHLYVGLPYDGISSFIGLESEAEESEQPVPVEKKAELGELLLWMFGSKRENKTPVIESQNPHLRQLDAVVTDPEAVAALRKGLPLSVAHEISRPAPNVFEEALVESKRSLEKARSLLTTGYSGSKNLLSIADDVAQLADDLYREMERKSSPRKRSRAS